MVEPSKELQLVFDKAVDVAKKLKVFSSIKIFILLVVFVILIHQF